MTLEIGKILWLFDGCGEFNTMGMVMVDVRILRYR